jgi:universal stress protein family protein
VTLIHVVRSPFHGTVFVESRPDLLEALHDSASEMVRSVADEVTAEAGAGPVTWSVVGGWPVALLREFSAEGALLVLGSRGTGGVAHLRLGSTASGVAAGAACPVMVLPSDDSVLVSGRRSVVVGVEGRRGDDEVLASAFDEAAASGTDLVAVHTWQDTGLDPAYLSAGSLLDWSSVRADEERVLAEALAGWREKRPDVVVREVVLRDKTARGLLAAALTAQLLWWVTADAIRWPAWRPRPTGS